MTDFPTMTIPLQTDAQGVIRVSETSVTLEAVIARYHQGHSPESIHDSFESLTVNDIYAVIAYYLSHRDALDAYLQRRESEIDQQRQAWESKYPPKVTRSALQSRLNAEEDQDR